MSKACNICKQVIKMNQGFWLMMAIIYINEVTSGHTLGIEPAIGDFNFL